MPFIFVRASRVRHQRRGSLISVISVIIPLWTPVQRVLRPTVLSRSCPSAIATWSPGALSFRCHLAVRSRNASDLADFCDFNEWSYKLVHESRQATNLQSDLERVMGGPVLQFDSPTTASHEMERIMTTDHVEVLACDAAACLHGGKPTSPRGKSRARMQNSSRRSIPVAPFRLVLCH